MAELSGFTTARRVHEVVGPQSFQVPVGKKQFLAQIRKIAEGLWDAVEADLSRNVRIEILKPDGGEVQAWIAPLHPNAVDRPVGNPGAWIVVDGTHLTAMDHERYATQFVAPASKPPTRGDEDGKPNE